LRKPKDATDTPGARDVVVTEILIIPKRFEIASFTNKLTEANIPRLNDSRVFKAFMMVQYQQSVTWNSK